MVDLWILVADIMLVVLYTWTYCLIYHRMKRANMHIRSISSNLKFESTNKIRAASHSTASISKGMSDTPNKQEHSQQIVNHRVEKSAKSITKVMKTLPWFPIVFVGQWTLYLMWKLILAQTWGQSMAVVIITNMGGMFNVIVFYRLLMNPVNKKKRERLKRMEMEMETRKNSKSHTNTQSDNKSQRSKNDDLTITPSAPSEIIVTTSTADGKTLSPSDAKCTSLQDTPSMIVRIQHNSDRSGEIPLESVRDESEEQEKAP